MFLVYVVTDSPVLELDGVDKVLGRSHLFPAITVAGSRLGILTGFAAVALANELGVDVDGRDVVDDARDVEVGRRQQPPEQRGLAHAEKA